MSLPFASFEDAGGIFIGVIMMMIPIIAILTSHQRKMAEMMRHDARQGLGPIDQTNDLRREVHDLKQLVSQLAIQMDDFSRIQRQSLQVPPSQPEAVQDRLNA